MPSWHFRVYSWWAQAFLLHLDGLVVEEIWRFWFFRWPHNWSVMWLFVWRPLILNQHPAKFWCHGPCEYGDQTCLICYVTTWWMCHLTLWVRFPHLKLTTLLSLGSIGLVKRFLFVTWPRYRIVMWLWGCDPLILNYHAAMFDVHTLNGTKNNGVCSISFNSNSSSNFNPNAEVLMPRFTNGPYFTCFKITHVFF